VSDLHDVERRLMVAEQIEARGVVDRAVLRAMREVPRHRFVAPELAHLAYADRALPADEDQTISQPYIVARMAEALALGPDDRVLEVGCGTGYAAAVMSRIAAEVFTIEIRPRLAETAAARLAALGYGTIRVRCADGSLGWPEEAPFDAISVAASGPDIPEALVEQLAPGGRLVLPVGRTRGAQELVRVTRTVAGVNEERLGAVMFVPLVRTS
jgi:protein-L-isoaspartate(D-aspartate) O-methyltransferase